MLKAKTMPGPERIANRREGALVSLERVMR